ncbi:MAG TPA: flagellin FliC [Candidatus Hydrogenedentes bacterium]|nr:flagellin FliC [Candidatus Hydrogenedentota bacterium]HIB53651.1 flagellin FliC [Nitrospirales bacterium]
MGVQINSNIPAIFARRETDKTVRSLSENQERLSSLLSINRASDVAAGLAIAERFRSQVREFNQEIKGFQSGSNLIDTAESALGSQSDAISRIRELATQASNGVLTHDQRAAINVEVQQLLEDIDDTARRTTFNGVNPLDNGNQRVALSAGGVELEFDESTLSSLDLENIDISTQDGARAALGALDDAQTQINSNRSNLGAQQSAVQSTIRERENSAINVQEAESRIRDLDVARAFVEQTRNEVLLQAGVSAIAQGNAQRENALLLLGG